MQGSSIDAFPNAPPIQRQSRVAGRSFPILTHQELPAQLSFNLLSEILVQAFVIPNKRICYSWSLRPEYCLACWLKPA